MESAMSTDFTPGRRIFARDLFDGRLPTFGVHEWVAPDQAPDDGQDDDLSVPLTLQSAQKRTLTDGRGNYLWVSINDDGAVAVFTRYGRNDTRAILGAVAEAFEAEIFSEDEPQFWGFETNEELEGHIREISLAISKGAQPREACLADGPSSPGLCPSLREGTPSSSHAAAHPSKDQIAQAPTVATFRFTGNIRSDL
jgi:hypothetical protein